MDAEVAAENAEVQTETPAPEVDIDSKIDAALSKHMAKLEENYKTALKESQRLEKMSEDERRAAELETARKELESKAAELKRKEIQLEMTRVLEQRGLPLAFMDYFLTDDNAATLERIKAFEKHYKGAIESAVNERLKGKAPAAAATADFKPQNSLAELIRKSQARR